MRKTKIDGGELVLTMKAMKQRTMSEWPTDIMIQF